MHLRVHLRAVRDPAVARLRLDQLQQLVAHLRRAFAHPAGQVEAVRQRPAHLVAGLRRQRGVVEDRLDAVDARDRAATGRQAVRRDRDAVAVRVARLHGVFEHQPVAARAPDVVRLAGLRPHRQPERGRPQRRIHQHPVAEGHRDLDLLALPVGVSVDRLRHHRHRGRRQRQDREPGLRNGRVKAQAKAGVTVSAPVEFLPGPVKL